MSDLYVRAGSFDPERWLVADPITKQPVDLTVSGYSVGGTVASTNDGTGTKLLDLLDDEMWARTAQGEIFFQPPSAVSAAWPSVTAYYQAYLYHPSGQKVRLDSGRFIIDTDLTSGG